MICDHLTPKVNSNFGKRSRSLGLKQVVDRMTSWMPFGKWVPTGKSASSARECDRCGFKEAGAEGEKKLFWCPCRLKKYCGKDCQKADWDSHKDQHREEVKAQKKRLKGGPPFLFATRINCEGYLHKAKEATRMHDKPFDVADMFSQMTTNGVVASIGGGQNDAPKGPPFNKDVSLVGTIESEVWLVFESPGQDLSGNPNLDAPDVKEGAALTGNYLSFYYGEMQWHGLGCWLSHPDHSIVMPFTNKRMPVRICDLPMPPFLVEGSSAAERSCPVVVARSDGVNWKPLLDFVRTGLKQR